MWCTRWYLPLLLLPMPTASPYFLALFLLTLFVQAKPCFYCIVLLVALFFSSCYWQPFPTSSLLYAPWSQNVTTFAEALNQSIPVAYDAPLPSVVRTLDRCWCDVWTSGFFEPYNVSQWEESSILRLATELVAAHKTQVEPVAETETVTSTQGNVHESMPRTAAPESTARGMMRGMWKRVSWPRRRRAVQPVVVLEPPQTETTLLSPLRWEYDLRSHGLGLVIDFAWTRRN
ncbi:hypothetical protein C8F01DRAFT_1206884 [Mycena amicta]|nr:hypothetical protein C8F01DRAFT_1206884 [Mycena amicta]